MELQSYALIAVVCLCLNGPILDGAKSKYIIEDLIMINP